MIGAKQHETRQHVKRGLDVIAGHARDGQRYYAGPNAGARGSFGKPLRRRWITPISNMKSPVSAEPRSTRQTCRPSGKLVHQHRIDKAVAWFRATAASCGDACGRPSPGRCPSSAGSSRIWRLGVHRRPVVVGRAEELLLVPGELPGTAVRGECSESSARRWWDAERVRDGAGRVCDLAARPSGNDSSASTPRKPGRDPWPIDKPQPRPVIVIHCADTESGAAIDGWSRTGARWRSM